MDALIERFLDGYLHPETDEWVSEPYGDEPDTFMPIKYLDDPGCSWGKCSLISMQFVAFLESNDMHEAIVSEQHGDYREHTPEWWGYHDYEEMMGAHPFMHTEDLLERHCVVLWDHDGFTYSIDFTSSQYGYDQVPLVQRAPEGPAWQRLAWQRSWPLVLQPLTALPQTRTSGHDVCTSLDVD